MAAAMLRSLMFLFLAVVLAAIPAAISQPARAQELLTANGVEVDVTGDSAAAARNAAFVVGQRKAFDQLIGQLVDPGSAASLPPLSDDQIGAMVSDFEIESERTSAVRYLGVLTFRFYADAIRQYLAGTGARFTATQSPPVVVVPILTEGESRRLWDDNNPWLAAWASHGGGALVPVRVPIGDLADIAAIDAERALAGDLAAFDALARRYGAADTLVAEANLVSPPTPDGEAVIAISARRYGPAGLTASFQEEVRGGGADMAALFARAVDALDAQLEQSWKSQALTTTGATMGNRIEVTAAIQGLDQWVEIQRRLQQVSVVHGIELRYLAMREARFDLVYDGDPMSLENALAGRGLQLASDGGAWALLLAGGFTPTVMTPAPETVTPSLEPSATDGSETIPPQP
jgi:hypothetical protein